jgi:hypothetical protein
MSSNSLLQQNLLFPRISAGFGTSSDLGAVTLTFPFTYNNPPNVFITVSNIPYYVNISNVTTTTFQVQIYDMNDDLIATPFDWFAINQNATDQ